MGLNVHEHITQVSVVGILEDEQRLPFLDKVFL